MSIDRQFLRIAKPAQVDSSAAALSACAGCPLIDIMDNTVHAFHFHRRGDLRDVGIDTVQCFFHFVEFSRSAGGRIEIIETSSYEVWILAMNLRKILAEAGKFAMYGRYFLMEFKI